MSGYHPRMSTSWSWSLRIPMLLACPATDDPETDDSSAATSTSDHGTSTSAADSSTAIPDDPDSSGAPTTDAPDTGTNDDPCSPYCDAVVACGGRPSTCLAECEARLRFRDDHYGADCRTATETTLACIADLTCDQMDAFACEETEISEVTICEGDTDPGPEVVAFCESQVECDIPASVCELAILQDFVGSAYAQGCETEYAAVLACVTPLGCMATDPEIEAACGAQGDALDAACPGLFD